MLIIDSGNGNGRGQRIAGLAVSGGPFRTQLVGSADEARQHLERDLFRLVYLVPSGKETEPFIRVLRQEHPETAVMVEYGGADPLAAVKLLAAGADHVFTGPYDTRGFAVQAAVAIERRQMCREDQFCASSLEQRAAMRERELATVRREIDQTFVSTIRSFVGLLETMNVNPDW